MALIDITLTDRLEWALDKGFLVVHLLAAADPKTSDVIWLGGVPAFVTPKRR